MKMKRNLATRGSQYHNVMHDKLALIVQRHNKVSPNQVLIQQLAGSYINN